MQNTHILAGYVLTTLVILRIVWGFVGTVYARFSDFIYKPSLVARYIKSTLAGHPQRYLGHNPAGGAMITIVLLTLIVMIISGFVIEASIEFEGPLLGLLNNMSDSSVFTWYDIHEFASDLMLVLIALHLLGVVMASRLHKENLVRAMFTGYKRANIE